MTPEQLAKSGSEHGEQMALFAWANRKQRSLDPNASVLDWLFAIPNGGLRHAAEANKLKAEGVKPGPADVCLPVSIRQFHHQVATLQNPIRYCGLYIEMKKRNGKPSDQSSEQKKFGAFVTEQGYKYALCFGWREARDEIICYLNLSMNDEWDTL